MKKRVLLLTCLVCLIPNFALTNAQKIQEYQAYLAKLNPTQPETLRQAIGSLKENYLDQNEKVRDQLFALYLTYYHKVTKKIDEDLQKKVTAYFDLDMKREKFKAKFGKSFLKYREDLDKKIEPYGLKLSVCEEMSFSIEENGEFILKEFITFVSPFMQEYLIIRDLEKNKDISMGCEGMPEYQIEKFEFDERKARLDSFIQRVRGGFIFLNAAKKFSKVYGASFKEYKKKFPE